MASSFTSIRDRRIKMPCVLGHYLLCNSSSTAHCGPTSVNGTCTISIPCAELRLIDLFPEQPLGNKVTKSAYLSYCFPRKLNNLLVGKDCERD